MPFEMSRADYHARYGLTTGDMLRLGDTNLYIRIERDYTSYGDEVLAGFGKTVRDGLMANSRLGRESELDVVLYESSDLPDVWIDPGRSEGFSRRARGAERIVKEVVDCGQSSGRSEGFKTEVGLRNQISLEQAANVSTHTE